MNAGRLAAAPEASGPLRVDVAINPGNSGGPVVDATGAVRGVAMAHIRGSDTSFLIPAEEVGRFLGHPAWLGWSTLDPPDALPARASESGQREWALPPVPVRREVLAATPPEVTDAPPVLFVPGFGHGAWAFAEHWLEHAAARGFPAYAMSLRGHGGKLFERTAAIVNIRLTVEAKEFHIDSCQGSAFRPAAHAIKMIRL